MHSIILTIHNKDWLVTQVLDGIVKNTEGEYELNIVIDGCTDKTFNVVEDYFYGRDVCPHTIITTPDVYETMANNSGLKNAKGEYVIIVQDDMIIKEIGWNERMRKPFKSFDDVFAVTSRTAHNYKINSQSQHLAKEPTDNGWSDILESCDSAKPDNTPRNIFAVRSTVNRGPLMINHKDLEEMKYLDEEFSPQDMDDHDLMFRMREKLGKVCGCYWIEVETDPKWGGTRKETGEPAPWLYKANQKNTKIFYERHCDKLSERIIEDRILD